MPPSATRVGICLFDLLGNNADRKAGHCLLGPDGRIYAVDNGLTSHAEPKLRTVIWEFAGQAIPRALLAPVRRFVAARIPQPLVALLAPAEREALHARCEAVLADPRFPVDTGGHRYPWPLV